MNAALQTAIYNLAITVSGLSAANFWYGQAAQGEAFPYAVFYGIPEAPSIEWDGGNIDKRSRVQFAFFGLTVASVNTLAEPFAAMFDFTELLMVAGWGLVFCHQLLDVPARRSGDVWRRDLDYRFTITKAR